MAETKDLLVTLEDLKVVHDDHVSKFAGKVDKVDGKGLSSNDYDDAAKAKVDAIPDNPKYTDTVYNDSELQEAVNQLNSNLQSTVGNLSELNTQEKTSLVAAINEALAKSGGEIAPDDVQRIVEDYLKANPPGTGTDGKDGITPTIGENGNWYLGDTDTGKPSRGTTGVPGKDGAKGKDGADGKSAYQYAQDGGYTGTETDFMAKLAQEILSGTTDDITPAQVHAAVSSGRPVKVQYTSSSYGVMSFTAFSTSETMGVIASQNIVFYNNTYILAELGGYIQSGKWFFNSTVLAEKKDIPTVPSSLKNPNALTIKIGSTTVTYDGSTAQTVTIADGTEVSY